MLELHSQFVSKHLEVDIFGCIDPFLSITLRDGRATFSSSISTSEINALLNVETALCKALDECRQAIAHHGPNAKPEASK